MCSKITGNKFHNNFRAELNFKLLPLNTDFPVSKPRRTSYDWYNPKGILKRNWLAKHLTTLPAVAVLFQELEWSDPQWTEKQLQCASNLRQIRNLLQGRENRLMLVLIQQSTGPNDDQLVAERIATLTSNCDITSKMLFVLPCADQVMNYVLQLESTFKEHALAYYGLMIRIIRSHRDQLTPTHQPLLVRHQFKLGILFELQQDQNTALKHYRQGYGLIEEIRIIETNCVEVKTVAGFFNYKICRLMFKQNMPREAITQFKNHIERYRSRSGFRELQFEHHTWMSTQYVAFAELFIEAVKAGLPALQTQHPGKYYYKAAEHMGRRKEAFLEAMALPLSPSDSVPLTGTLHSDFFGVRTIINGDAVGAETQVIRLLQEQERLYNHSGAIITLLGQAMAQFKLYKCLRFRKKLAVDMAEEYFKIGDYSKALTLYSLMLSDYRPDKWFTIFSGILMKTLRSAFLAASAVDFISCSIEALSPNILIEKNERIQILENLWKVLHGIPPISQQQLVPEVKTKWDTSLSALKSPVPVDLDKLNDILECKATFVKDKIKCDERFQLHAFIQNLTEIPLKVRRFTATLWDTKTFFRLLGLKYREHNGEELPFMEVSHEILLEPGGCYQIEFESTATVAENVELQIMRLEMDMGSDKNWVTLSTSNSINRPRMFKDNFFKRDKLQLVPVTATCYVTPTFHVSTQTKQPEQPMLVNEYYRLLVRITNNFDLCLQAVGISITVPQSLRNRVFLTTDLGDSMQKLSSSIQIDIGDLQMQGVSDITYYLISLVEGSIELRQKVWYQVDAQQEINVPNTSATLDSPTSGAEVKPNIVPKKFHNTHDIKIEYLDGAVKKIKEDTIVVACVEEISFNARFYTLSRQALMRAYGGEDFILRVNMDVKAPVDISILDFYFISDHNISEKWRKNNEKIKAGQLSQGTRLEDVMILRPERCTNDWLSKSDYLSKTSNEFVNRRRKISSTIQTSQPEVAPPTIENIGKNLLAGKIAVEDVASLSSTGSTRSKAEDKNILITKTIYNNAVDSLHPTQNYRNGFINQNATRSGIVAAGPIDSKKIIFGYYCVRWKRVGSTNVNESKFVVAGVDVVDPPLNIYCYFEKEIYAKVPVNFKITLKNPTSRIINLLVTLNSAVNFMYAGHRVVSSQATFKSLILNSLTCHLTILAQYYDIFSLFIRFKFQSLPTQSRLGTVTGITIGIYE